MNCFDFPHVLKLNHFLILFYEQCGSIVFACLCNILTGFDINIHCGLLCLFYGIFNESSRLQSQLNHTVETARFTLYFMDSNNQITINYNNSHLNQYP